MAPRNSKQQARRLFMDVVDLTDAERSAELDRACGGDAGLRAEVETLLRAERAAGGFLSSPTAQRQASEQAGAQIGRYKLLEQIGEGGMGTIWMAEQREPVKRRVALKIIKLGMDTRQVIARFEAERQALALMDHPNIAKVLDAGSTETGRPYFVMEYIKGIPILEFCDQEKLDTRARLELFASVCHAIQHAHQKGIIHRDIKPSNVLVTLHDGVPVPKVIDFGIAKATNSELTTKTLFTEHRQMIGTPAYMSPEQAEMSGLDIDTRSDVYSLGVLLYELLTGTTPFDTKALLESGFGEMLRAIREDEPHKPSTRVSTLGDTGTRTAQQRRVDAKKLSLLLRGDIDWIVMKCLEKDRTRRYDTANGLAADIKRHLGGDAVLAAPPSASYRMRKFVRRHRVQVAAAGLVVAALLLGLGGTVWQAKVASERAARAKKAEAEARTARDAEKARADELWQVSEFQKQMLKQVDPATAGVRLTEDVRRRFAAALEKAKVPDAERDDQAVAFQTEWARVNATDAAAALIDETILKPAVKAIDEQFKDQPVVDALLRQVLASRYDDLGLYDSAYPLQRSALETRRRVRGPESLETLNSVCSMGLLLEHQGKLAEAEPYLREALEVGRRVRGEENSSTLADIGNLGMLLFAQGKLAEAEPYCHDVLEKTRRIRGEQHASTLIVINNMGTLLEAQGKLAEAEPYFREALEKGRVTQHPLLLNFMGNLGDVLLSQGKLDQAEPYLREVLETSRRVRGEEHPNTLTALNNMGRLLEDQGKFAEAEPYLREALEKRRRVLGEEQADTLLSINNMGGVLQSQGKLDQAEMYFRDGLEKSRRVLGEEHPDTVRYIHNMGALLRAQGKLADAEPFYRESLEKHRRVLGEEHPHTFSAVDGLGGVLLALGKFAEAEPVYAEGIGACQRAFKGPHPTTALLLHHHADSLRALGRLDDALPGARAAVDMYREHLEWPANEAGHALSILLSILRAQGRPDEALAVRREWLAAERRHLPPASTGVANEIRMFAEDLLKRGTLEAVREAEPLLRECLEIRIKAIPDSWLVSTARSLLGGAILARVDLDPELTLESRVARLREAEPLLLDGYAGVKDNPAVPTPAQTGGVDRRREALERVVHLYEVWDKTEPGQGYDAKAAEWKATK